jgi:LPXTG-motif cell wall-anchored protein
MQTNANGLYLFAGLEPGTYTVELVLSSIPRPQDGDLRLTTAGSFTVTLDDGEEYLDADFGVVATLPRTGIASDSLLIIALGLLAMGALAVLVSRRRSDDGSSDTGAT